MKAIKDSQGEIKFKFDDSIAIDKKPVSTFTRSAARLLAHQTPRRVGRGGYKKGIITSTELLGKRKSRKRKSHRRKTRRH